MKKLIIITICISLFFACTETQVPLPFINLLNRTKMIFTEPYGYILKDSLQSRGGTWDLTYIHPVDKFEVRYAIQPMDVLLKEYQEDLLKKDSNENLIHPNKLYHNKFKKALLNISDGRLPEYTVMTATSAKSEFNADWGATATVDAGKEFGIGYKYCQIVLIHKDNIGDAFVYFLGDDIKIIRRDMGRIVHNLKFDY